ncbi:uncharacterized protein MCYG_07477 [Microsporum canis CBS 113480]|uniref:Uncharacterized protein n=1 Tax=Arthroderma otae (strain ATCC MYA-4605 / CBS 113480) TaxID=554155 RepID=C5FYR0_ARTOC|nr:uncharacterized protein MCYG_07477 [Microsporum canis CBS 113480]EEQ34658.1 predicted protein [Microsporum canis CBS 113480]
MAGVLVWQAASTTGLCICAGVATGIAWYTYQGQKKHWRLEERRRQVEEREGWAGDREGRVGVRELAADEKERALGEREWALEERERALERKRRDFEVEAQARAAWAESWGCEEGGRSTGVGGTGTSSGPS